jgi:hypothetical protein
MRDIILYVGGTSAASIVAAYMYIFSHFLVLSECGQRLGEYSIQVFFSLSSATPGST